MRRIIAVDDAVRSRPDAVVRIARQYRPHVDDERPRPDRSAKSLCGFVEAAVEPGAVIVTDAWPAYSALIDRGYRHLPVAVAGDPDMIDDYLPLVHIAFSNLKSWLRGCHHGVSPQHLQAYLNEFAFRFNRRFYPFNAFRSLLGIGGRTAGPTYDGGRRSAFSDPSPARRPPRALSRIPVRREFAFSAKPSERRSAGRVFYGSSVCARAPPSPRRDTCARSRPDQRKAWGTPCRGLPSRPP
jgi:hypothetical protein